MPKLAIDVGTVLLLILPGFLAYRFSVLQRADPTVRSVLWQVSEILEHSLYVHLLGAALAFGLHLALGSTTHIEELIKHGPQNFLENYFAEAIRWYVGYAIYMIVASAIIGAYSLPERVSTSIPALLRASQRYRLLKWLPVPGIAYPQDPIWHYAFMGAEDWTSLADTDANDSDDGFPIVFVRMKDSGDVYIGEIASYPIVPDTQAEKDFLITDTTYYQAGNLDDELDLASVDGIGAVLLNSRDVESVRVVYRRGEDD